MHFSKQNTFWMRPAHRTTRMTAPMATRMAACMASVCMAAVLLCAAKGLAADAIRFAYQDRIGSVLPIVAVNKGFFAEQGVAIEALRFNSGPACAEALYSGAADIGGMGDTAAILMIARNPQYVIFASHATGEHRHRLMIRQDAAIGSLAGLRGKRLAVKKGTSTHGGLLVVLDAAGIDPASIELIDLAPPAMVTALQAGSIDVFAASEPTPSVAEEKGAKQLLTLGGQGNLYPILMLARREFLEKNTEQMQRFVQALRKAQDYVAAHPEETVALMSAETGLSPASTRAAMERHQYSLRLDSGITGSLQKTAQFLHEQKMIGQEPDWTTAIHKSFVGQYR